MCFPGDNIVKGGKWKYQVYFDMEANDKRGKHYAIDDKDLMKDLKERIGINENIKYVRAYKSPLASIQLTDFLLYHMFIEFETDEWWWTIEKDGYELILRRSKIRSAVRENNKHGKRNRITLLEEDQGCKNVFDLIDWLYRSNEVNKPFDLLQRNCKDFGKAVFNQVARNKSL